MTDQIDFSPEILKIASVYLSTELVIREAEQAYNTHEMDRYNRLQQYLDKKFETL